MIYDAGRNNFLSHHRELVALRKVKLWRVRSGKELRVNLHKSVGSDTWGRKSPLEGTLFMSSLVSVPYKDSPGGGKYGVEA